MTALVVYSTCPDADCADRLARALVEERLAACVNVVPGVRSTYRWQGRVEQADEVLLMIKTRHHRLEALTARLQQLHPYELPEVLAVEVRDGLDAYLAWLTEQIRTDA